MSLIMDALKKAQQLRLKHCGNPSPLKDPGAFGPTLSVPRRKRASLLAVAFFGLVTILLGWFFVPPWALKHQSKQEVAVIPLSGKDHPRETLRQDEMTKTRSSEPEAVSGKKGIVSAEKSDAKMEEKREAPKARKSQKAPPSSQLLPSRKIAAEPSPEGEPKRDEPPSCVEGNPAPSFPRPSSQVDPKGLFNWALRHQNEGDLERAIEAYSKVIETDPSCFEAYNNLGLLYQEKGDSQRAREAFKRALGIRPNYVKALNNLGILYYHEERYEEALDCFEGALASSPDHVESHLHRGLVLKRKGEPEKAVEAFERALRLNPLHSETHYNLALLLEDLQRIDGAIEHYERFLQTASQNHSALAEKVANHLRALRRRKGN